MTKRRSWTDLQLSKAVEDCFSIRQVIAKLGLVAAGGNYEQVKKYVKELGLSTDHFTGMGWRKNRVFGPEPRVSLEEILINGSTFQSFKLKNRLFQAGLKKKECELCGWSRMSVDGRIPLELDHINGDRHDNRIKNLRVLCPNCHSLEPTHRGLNKKKRSGGETGRHATLKML
jgi:hypothetical protein